MVARGVQAPCLVATGPALDIEFEARALRAHHERHHTRCHSAAHRMTGRNPVVRERIAHRHPPQDTSGSGVVDLAFKHGSPEGVECHLLPGYQPLEIALEECFDGRGRAKPRLGPPRAARALRSDT